MSYVTYTLENILAISKFMSDHGAILYSILPSEKSRLIALKETKLYNKFLIKVLMFSFNKISHNFLKAEILMTNYSIYMFNKTQELYNILNNQEIDISIKNLISHSKIPKSNFSADEIDTTHKLSIELLSHLNTTINKLKSLSEKIIEGKEVILFSKNFIDHLLDEVEIFIYTLEFLERGMSFTPTYVYKCNYYFNVISKEHVTYIKNMSFPTNPKYLPEVNHCESKFVDLVNMFDDDISPCILDKLNTETKKASSDFAYFNSELMHTIMVNNVFVAIVPILSDHILRETNYINYQLSVFNMMS